MKIFFCSDDRSCHCFCDRSLSKPKLSKSTPRIKEPNDESEDLNVEGPFNAKTTNSVEVSNQSLTNHQNKIVKNGNYMRKKLSEKVSTYRPILPTVLPATTTTTPLTTIMVPTTITSTMPTTTRPTAFTQTQPNLNMYQKLWGNKEQSVQPDIKKANKTAKNGKNLPLRPFPLITNRAGRLKPKFESHNPKTHRIITSNSKDVTKHIYYVTERIFSTSTEGKIITEEMEEQEGQEEKTTVSTTKQLEKEEDAEITDSGWDSLDNQGLEILTNEIPSQGLLTKKVIKNETNKPWIPITGKTKQKRPKSSLKSLLYKTPQGVEHSP